MKMCFNPFAASTTSTSTIDIQPRHSDQTEGDNGGGGPMSGPKPMLPYSSMFIFGPTNPWVHRYSTPRLRVVTLAQLHCYAWWTGTNLCLNGGGGDWGVWGRKEICYFSLSTGFERDSAGRQKEMSSFSLSSGFERQAMISQSVHTDKTRPRHCQLAVLSDGSESFPFWWSLTHRKGPAPSWLQSLFEQEGRMFQ